MYKIIVSLFIYNSKMNICNLPYVYVCKEKEICNSRRSLLKTGVSELDMMLEICQCNDLFNQVRSTVE